MIVKKTSSILLCLMTVMTVAHAENRALLVGIDEYQQINSLSGSKQDVINMTQFLQANWHYQPTQIRTLINHEATKSEILRVFDSWLIRGTQPGDKVLFYYSGHGTYVRDRSHDEIDRYDEALCPFNSTRLKRDLILDDEMNQRLEQLKARQVTIIIDASHSGTMAKSISFRDHPDSTIKVPIFKDPPKRQTANYDLKKEGFIKTQEHVVSYTAVATHQVAVVDTSVYPHTGVFTRRFIQGIEDNHADSNDDGKVSHRELLDYMRRESHTYCKVRPYQCPDGLTPQLNIKPSLLDQDIRLWSAMTAPSIPESIESRLNNDLQIDIVPYTLKQDQKMRVQVSSQRNGHLLVLDASHLDTTKTLTRLFPNRYTLPGYVKAGKVFTIPDPLSGFEIVAKSPGKRLIVALLVDNASDLSIVEEALPKAFKQLKSTNAQTLSQQLNEQLRKVLLQKQSSPYVILSILTKTYEIKP
ncbi:MAG: caspase family protein [Candidatus Parabeggiatoa sp.]|nr:caspase family protein [Candidatus Parabeggiatoa sp.]